MGGVMSECIIENFDINKPEMKKLVQEFVEVELCPCARETFYAHELGNIPTLKEALFHAVINEMVLRKLAAKVSVNAA